MLYLNLIYIQSSPNLHRFDLLLLHLRPLLQTQYTVTDRPWV